MGLVREQMERQGVYGNIINLKNRVFDYVLAISVYISSHGR